MADTPRSLEELRMRTAKRKLERLIDGLEEVKKELEEQLQKVQKCFDENSDRVATAALFSEDGWKRFKQQLSEIKFQDSAVHRNPKHQHIIQEYLHLRDSELESLRTFLQKNSFVYQENFGCDVPSINFYLTVRRDSEEHMKMELKLIKLKNCIPGLSTTLCAVGTNSYQFNVHAKRYIPLLATCREKDAIKKLKTAKSQGLPLCNAFL
jgi:hypothetical protein